MKTLTNKKICLDSSEMIGLPQPSASVIGISVVCQAISAYHQYSFPGWEWVSSIPLDMIIQDGKKAVHARGTNLTYTDYQNDVKEKHQQ